MARIVIDPGHGFHDPGAVNLVVGVQEKDVNLRVATRLYQALLWAGHSPLMTRDGDKFLPLADRVAISNTRKAEAFISIHCNAAGSKAARGMEVWTSPGKTKADALATAIGEALRAAFPGTPFRADWSDGDLDKEGRFYVLTKTLCPAVLVECGFISNDEEARWLKTPGVAEEIARAISLGTCRWAETLKGGIGV